MRVRCVIDNCVAASSPLWGEHGLAMLITTEAGTLLWDTGGSGDVLVHNLRELNVPFDEIDAVALSHAHNDHTGGLGAVLERVPGIPVHLHPSAFEPRYSMRPGRQRNIGMAQSEEELSRHATLERHEEPFEILSGVFVTGAVQPRPYPPGASAHHRVMRDGRELPDPYADDMSLVLETAEGLVLVCGCCHAGLRNTLASVTTHWAGRIRAVLGGTHLATAPEKELDAVAQALEALGPPEMYLNHCTGDKAIARLQRAWPDRVHPLPAGAEISF
ncbi:MAG: MBL fold metallo-hydrolase [Anaerolineae bacterium]